MSTLGVVQEGKFAFRQYNQFFSRDFIFLDCFSYRLLRNTLLWAKKVRWEYVRVYVCGIPGLDPSIPRCFQQWQGLVFIQNLVGPSVGSIWHTTENWLLPQVLWWISLTFETLSPVLPSRTYFIVAVGWLSIISSRSLEVQDETIIRWKNC